MNQCGGGEDPPDPPPDPDPENPWCTVIVNGVGSFSTTAEEISNNVSVYVQADANSGTNKNVMLYVTKKDAAAMSPPPNGTLYTVNYSGAPVNSYSYNFYRMAIYQSASNVIGNTTTLTLPEGEYYIMCNVEGADGGQCSGNPFCGFNAPLNPDSGLTPYLTCSGWASCSSDDVKHLRVTAPRVSVSGRVYENEAGQCSGTTAPAADFGGRVVLAGNATSTPRDVNRTQSSYSFPNVKGRVGSGIEYTATFTLPNPGPYVLAPACQAQHTFNVYNADINDKNFFITQKADPWFQAVRGDIGAGNGSVTGGVPATLYSSNQRFAMPFVNDAALPQRAGAVINSGTYVSDPAGQDVSSAKWKANGGFGGAAALSEGYEFFMAGFEMGTPTDNIPGNSIASLPVLPGNPDLKVYWNDTNLDVTDLTVSDGKPAVIFVNGNANITGNITVNPGNFLAIITNGSITFGPGVTVAQGVFIADTTLTVQNATSGVGLARQFKGEGIFAGLGEGGVSGVVLSRNLNNGSDNSDDLANNSNPGELFTYRPEFLLLAPDGFKWGTVSWQEIEPVNIQPSQ